VFKKQAIEYAKRRWPVFPCNGKIPLTTNGYKDASIIEEVVDKMFSAHPNCNIGLVTGKISGLFVLDIDIKGNAGGAESLLELEKSHSPIPLTIRSSTWSKGSHIFFKYPEHGIGCKAGIKPGIDIRGDGGYVIVPPSTINGNLYEWVKGFGPDEALLTNAPDWLIDLIDERKPTIDLSKDEVKILKSKRNSSLASIAGSMRKNGLLTDEIESILYRINIERCEPPLSKREINAIAQSISRYEPDNNIIKPKDGIDYTIIADYILKENKIIYCAGVFYKWEKTCVYKELPIEFVQKLIKAKLGKKFCINKTNEIVHSMRVEAAIGNTEILNKSELLNLKNGLFNTDTFELLPHDSSIYSTIQFPINYNPKSICPLWLSSLDNIFHNNPDNIEILQEFLGLCLIKETKYDKALFMLGEGRNGKSTILYIFQHVLGEVNTSSVSLEMLDNTHYVADLFGKLVNVSIETSAKASINDAKFKSIISGDMLHADRKYGQPFDFRPFSKLIFALNNMPQVSDKTDAFFHRLLIIKFNKQFKEEEQDKDLKYKIVDNELDGIFLWMIKGLQRLKKRGFFQITNDMKIETDEYRKENNNVLTFVEEECQLDNTNSISKKSLYENYVMFCKNSGMKSLSKKKFGAQLIKHFGLEKEQYDSSHLHRIWVGVDLINNFNYIKK